MKKTTLLVAGTMIGISILSLSQPVLATVIDGENSANVEINGTIGKLDNIDPEEKIPEGSDEWINVTVDTATAFHTTTASKHRVIDSANYSIANNSGRAVNVSVANLTGTPKLVESLSLNTDIQGNPLVTPEQLTLIENNQLAELNGSTQWLKLANANGKFNLETDQANQFANSATFSYSGTTTADASLLETTAKEDYTMTLKFEAIQADGVTVGR
ncbi:hypothetical protein ACWN8P_00750 [Vagococcus salmoninarum]|uniref:WxL domain-containing protein n=1 Tax=Vagococcus salmoninarum TaxID=2739 RepID=A0A429ZVS1_9ENTE|nr:hypothetical protein [Vagococcus salmoninarum]RST97861.1 hypothetical protein CBF35_00790 [Vagococcus salmoninarum]